MGWTLLGHVFLVMVFVFNACGIGPLAWADDLRLPLSGVRVSLSPPFAPALLKGIKVYLDNPFRFDFVLDPGQRATPIKEDALALTRFFLTALTIPEEDLWVNLSPYEKNRIIPQSFGLTEMGRDLLAEDYILKQITASLMYPQEAIGKEFWHSLYTQAAKKFKTTAIAVNTFNKVWIVPQKAFVYENLKTHTAYVVESKLKVMLEEDYLSLQKHKTQDALSTLSSEMLRAIIIPQLTKEVNEGKHFAKLRQIYNSLILATWYKKKIKDSLWAEVYSNQNKTAGVEYTHSILPLKSKTHFKNDIEGLYQAYLQAFKKGVYNYIQEEQDPITKTMIPRKYFSGGFNLQLPDAAMQTTQTLPEEGSANPLETVDINVNPAMFSGNSLRLGMIRAGIERMISDQEESDNMKIILPYGSRSELLIIKEVLNQLGQNDFFVIGRTSIFGFVSDSQKTLQTQLDDWILKGNQKILIVPGALYFRDFHQKEGFLKKINFKVTKQFANMYDVYNKQRRIPIHLEETKAKTDPLTGLDNRRGFENHVHQLFLEKNKIIRVNAILLDIDFFKYFNTAYGYATGDITLRSVAGSLKKSIRGSEAPCRIADILARWGGEEFVVLQNLGETDDGFGIADRVRGNVVKTLQKMSFLSREKVLTSLDVYMATTVRPTDVLTRLELRILRIAKHFKKDRLFIQENDLGYQALLHQVYVQNTHLKNGEIEKRYPTLRTLVDGLKDLKSGLVFNGWQITVTMGVVTGYCANYEDVESLLEMAGENVNAGKRNGRNTIVSTRYDNRFTGNSDLASNGGIDLRASMMNVQTETAGGRLADGGSVFHWDPAMLQTLKDAPGFVPVLVEMHATGSLQAFLSG